MESIIFDFVKRQKVAVVLAKKVFRGLLDVYYFNFVGRDGKYYSFMAACNDTQIFTKPSVEMIGDCHGIEPLENLYGNLIVSNTKGDWLLDRWDIKLAKNFNRHFAESLNDKFTFNVNTGEYSVMSSKLWVRPMLGFSIVYKHEGHASGVINVVSGCKTQLCGDYAFYQFLDELGILDYVEFKLEEEIVEDDDIRI